jgi:hypothetical protein
MKKIFRNVVTAISMMSASFAFAANASKVDLVKYFTSQKTNGAASTVKKMTLFATDITILNRSDNPMYVFIPESNGNVSDYIGSGGVDRIWSETYYGLTHLVLKNALMGTFYDGLVCRNSVVAVYGTYHNDYAVISNERC